MLCYKQRSNKGVIFSSSFIVHLFGRSSHDHLLVSLIRSFISDHQRRLTMPFERDCANAGRKLES